jgi:hypothetical protein
VSLDQPVLVAPPLELVEGRDQLDDGGEVADPQPFLFGGPEESLANPVTLRLPDSSNRRVPLFRLPETTTEKQGVPTWWQLDRSTREELLVLLTQLIGHNVPRSCANDERGWPDEWR